MDKKSDQKLDSDDELLNLDNELYSLTHYADNEEELVAQMFASIKGSKLEVMMPPILKEIPLIDLQQLCLHELRGMSQRRILSIINGQEMSGSSSEDQDSDDDQKLLKDRDKNNDSSEISTKAVLAEAEKALQDGDEVANLKKMDLLELEMRAKLIKTMLEKQDKNGIKQENCFDPNIKIKQEPLSPTSSRANSRSSSRSSSRSRSSSYYRSRSSYSSYSSRSSRSGSSARSISRRKKRSDSSSDSEEDGKRSSKKKLTKREFEERMKRAKMNRTYRRRKGSDEDEESGLKKRQQSKMSSLPDEEVVKENELDTKNIGEDHEDVGQVNNNNDLVSDKAETEQVEKVNEEEMEEGEEGEVIEKEEGEIDSNDEGGKKLDDKKGRRDGGRSRSGGSSRSYSSSYYSSRSRSRSPSVRRHRSKKKKRRRRHRRRHYSSRSKSPSEKEVPKIPNWNASEESMLPTKRNKEKIESNQDIASRKCVELNLPGREERQSISFSINKKSAPGKSNPELNDDGLPGETSEDLINSKVEETCERTISRLSIKDLAPNDSDNDTTTLPENYEGNDSKLTMNRDNFASDFYKGADQLEFSEEEEEEEKEMEVTNDEPSFEEHEPTSKAVPSDHDVEEEGQLAEDTSEDQSSQFEIIGTIDPKENELLEQTFDEDLAGGSASWSMRWLQSEKVQKVVSNSKMLSKVRKNIQAKGKKAPTEYQGQLPSKLESKVDEVQQLPKQIQGSSSATNLATTSTGMIGSMEEYEKMFGIKVKAPTSLPQPKSAPKPAETPSVAVSLPPSLLDSDGDEDSEDDAIWSKIMKK